MRIPRWSPLVLIAIMWQPAGAEPPEPSYTLRELQAIARAAHPALDSAQAAFEGAQGALDQARAYPNPAIAAAFGRGRPEEGGDSKSESTIALALPIELPGIRKWRARTAETGLQAAELERSIAGSIVDSTVARLAYTVLVEERRAAIARDGTALASRLHDLLGRRAELGESAPLETVRAETEWFARRREVLDAEYAATAARSALSYFCGERLGERYSIAETLERGDAAELPDDLGERLRSHNPILLRAGVAIEEAQARTETKRKEAFPSFDVLAGYESEVDRTGTSVGVGLTLPLWNRNQGAVAAALAESHRAAADARALTLELETALARASADYGRALSAVRLHGEGWTAAARRALDIATFSFENGEASLLEVLDAQRARLGVLLDEVESLAGLALARAEIERLIGGPLESEGHDDAR